MSDDENIISSQYLNAQDLFAIQTALAIVVDMREADKELRMQCLQTLMKMAPMIDEASAIARENMSDEDKAKLDEVHRQLGVDETTPSETLAMANKLAEMHLADIMKDADIQ